MNKRQAVYNKYNGRCAYTGKPLGSDWQIDHIEAKRYSDNNDISNLAPALPIVNHYKRGLGLEGFREYMLGFHSRLSKLPKKTSSEKTKRRIDYMYEIAKAFDITPDKPFDGVFYFEKSKTHDTRKAIKNKNK